VYAVSRAGWHGLYLVERGHVGREIQPIKMLRGLLFEVIDGLLRQRMDAHLYWPGAGGILGSETVLRRCWPLARDLLGRWGVTQVDVDRLARGDRAALAYRLDRCRVG
jgi:hypothetical protein